MKINLSTESIARAAAKRPWLTIGIWITTLVGAFALISILMGGALTNDNNMTNNPESAQASAIITDRLGAQNKVDETLIVNSETLTVDDAAFKSQVESLFADLTALGPDVVLGGTNYYQTGEKSLVSADRHSTMVLFAMPPDGYKKVNQVYQITDKITAAGIFHVYETGSASFNADANGLAEKTMKTGETVGIAVALVVLAIVFGAITASLLPIALGIVAIVIAMGLTAVAGHMMDLSFSVTNMITMMGLAVGIDYSLFVVTRFREERQKGLNKIDAIGATGATASRAIFFSGLTVILALVSLVIFPMTIFHSMGLGAILVVFAAIMATLTLLPALLSLFGDRVNSLRLPFLPRVNPNAETESTTGFWAKTTRIVIHRPVFSLVTVVVILALAIVPYFDKKTGMSGISGLPDNLRAKQGYLVLQQEFHLGFDTPAMIVVDGDIKAADTQAAITLLQQKIAGDAAFTYTQVAAYPDKKLAVIYSGLAGDPLNEQAMDAVARLRADYIPAAFTDSSSRVLVTGQTAGILDFNQTTNNYTPVVFIGVLSLSFIILTLAFRSIVIPATAILMNLLSVGASYGLIVLVFQKGVGAKLFGFQKVDVIESWLPLFLFAVLFGLSMDYHVFLLSRIREHFQKTGNNTESVSFGLRSTGKLITGAALIMVAVFGGFALGDMVMFQQMGFGLAVAVLLDATLVRSVLVPATMKILGKYNWYFPKWLEWLPNVSLGEKIGENMPVHPPITDTPEHPFPVGVAVLGRQTVAIKINEQNTLSR